MHIPLLIEKKRDGGRLSAAEIRCIIQQFTLGKLPDYQMSALAMAVFFQGLDEEETAIWTAAMRDSGEVYQWPAGTPPKVDKHSTGGVGDKVSLVLAPLLACDGLWVPMVSGRGLGITGGTLDKLESIPGFRTRLTGAEALHCLEKNGCFLAGQSETFCPADRKLYALRDVTGTVPSQALIVASIMSKKLAESLDRLVLDVKFGSGAFMKTREDAAALAHALQKTGCDNGVATSFVLNPMSEPLGCSAGNALEVAEAVATLQGGGPEDFRETVLDLSERISNSPRHVLEKFLSSGAAWKRFVRLVEEQGGDASCLEQIAEHHKAPFILPLPAPADGILRRFDAGVAGATIVRLGGGRQHPTDDIDPRVGLSRIVKCGATVTAGEPLCLIHAATEADARRAADELLAGMEVFSS